MKQPVGRYLADPAFLYFCPSPSLAGVQWRSLDLPGMQRLISVLSVNFTLARHRVFVDASRLNTVSPLPFAILARHLALDPAQSEARIIRRGIACPAGPTASFVREFYAECGAMGPTKLFPTPEAALRWLGVDDARSLLADLDVLERRSYAVSSETLSLRFLLERDAVRTLDEAAEQLACERRTLQRRLRAQGTSFRRELDLARIQRAKALMVSSHAPLTQIAYDVGCNSPQHFSWLFHKVTGETPSTWRRSNSVRQRSR